MLLSSLMVGAEPRAFAYRASALPFFDRGSIHKALSDFFQPDLDLCALLEVTLRASRLHHTHPGSALVSVPRPPHSSPGADKPGSCTDVFSWGSHPQ